jgi:Xaa-Pro aminopeptidase
VSGVDGEVLGPLSVAGRLDRLRPRMTEARCDALLVTDLANVRYLTGFTGSAAVLFVGGDQALLVTDGRYRTQAAEQLSGSGVASDVELFVGGGAEQRQALVGALSGAASRRLGLEADAVSWAAQRRWAAELRESELIPTSGLVEGLRLVKDEGELARMAHAASVADAALADVLPLLSAGTTEAEMALALDSAMRRGGAEDRAFETIVASGPNSAKPHARPSHRRMEPGDPVVVDFGAVYDGYRSDMTRTFFVGHAPSGDMARVLEVVAAAQAAGVAAVGPGVVTGDVDRACRQLVTDAGFGPAFEHGTGHGVGLHVHEAPAVAAGATAILEPGVVVTVEPGVYLAGRGGVRIEDTVVVTDDGCRPLTRFPKEPVP